MIFWLMSEDAQGCVGCVFWRCPSPLSVGLTVQHFYQCIIAYCARGVFLSLEKCFRGTLRMCVCVCVFVCAALFSILKKVFVHVSVCM